VKREYVRREYVRREYVRREYVRREYVNNVHSSRFTHHASRFTLHSSRFTPHSSRFTPHIPFVLIGNDNVQPSFIPHMWFFKIKPFAIDDRAKMGQKQQTPLPF